MTIKIQKDVFTIIGVTIFLAILIIVLSKKIDKQDPLEKPKGILLPVILGVEKYIQMWNTMSASARQKSSRRTF